MFKYILRFVPLTETCEWFPPLEFNHTLFGPQKIKNPQIRQGPNPMKWNIFLPIKTNSNANGTYDWLCLNCYQQHAVGRINTYHYSFDANFVKVKMSSFGSSSYTSKSCQNQRDQVWQIFAYLAKFKSLEISLGFIFYLESFITSLAYSICYWANFHYCKRTNIEEII